MRNEQKFILYSSPSRLENLKHNCCVTDRRYPEGERPSRGWPGHASASSHAEATATAFEERFWFPALGFTIPERPKKKKTESDCNPERVKIINGEMLSPGVQSGDNLAELLALIHLKSSCTQHKKHFIVVSNAFEHSLGGYPNTTWARCEQLCLLFMGVKRVFSTE